MFQSAGRNRDLTISCIACSALDTKVPPDAGPWKKVSSSTSSARSVWLGHRARNVHQAKHDGLGDRLWHGFEAAVSDVDRINVGDPAKFRL
jgi:hypothetical protein